MASLHAKSGSKVVRVAAAWATLERAVDLVNCYHQSEEGANLHKIVDMSNTESDKVKLSKDEMEETLSSLDTFCL